MKQPKVLVAAPTYEGKHYIFPKWYEHIQKLTYPNYDFLIVDNSKRESYSVGLRRAGYKKVKHIPRGGNSRIAIARASEYIRTYALENGYDYLMFIETDLFPPINIIQRLMGHQKPVVGAVYEVGLHGSIEAPRRPLLYNAIEDPQGVKLEICSAEEGYGMLNKGLIRTPACGFGCTLIHNTILKKYKFKYTSTSRLHTDMLFYWEMWNNNDPVWVDTDLNILHINQNWSKVKDW